MKIGIDARFFGARQKGLGRYVQKLVENLEIVDSDNQYVIFLRRDNWREYQPKNSNFKKVLANYKWYGFREQLFFPFEIYKKKVDLMHFPHFNVPFFYFSPFVVTIHDLVLKKFPTRSASRLGPAGYFLKNLAYRLIIYSAVKRAKKIIAVSHYTKKDILKYFNVDSQKIEVIYEGVPEKPINNNKEGIKIKKPYLLYVGNAYPHKNLEKLIRAFKKIVDEGIDLRLVLAGELDYFYKGVKKIADALPDERIIFTDFLKDEEIAYLYKNASLYIFPSLCEGFGLPPLEAMTYGLPVVLSKASCLPEVCGQAALYFDPENVDSMVREIKRALNDNNLRRELASRGYKRVKKYSWQKMGEETVGVYRKK